MRISGNVARSTSSKQRGHEHARRAELGQHTALMGAFRKVHWDAKGHRRTSQTNDSSQVTRMVSLADLKN